MAWEEFEYWDEPTMPRYLIHSNCFVIYFFGRDDVANDMLDRIIVAFGNDSANATLTLTITTPPFPKSPRFACLL